MAGDGTQATGAGAADLDDAAFRQAVKVITEAVADRLPDGDAYDPAAAWHVIEEQVRHWCREQLLREVAVKPATQQRLIRAVWDERFELGVLTPYVRDERVESIDINGCDQVWVTYRDGTRACGPAVAADDDELITMIQMWVLHKSYSTREFSSASPMANAALRPGDSASVGVRLSAAMSVTHRPCVSIRCHRLVDVTLDHLMALGTVDQGLNAFLTAAVRARKNIVITGGTAAGKTTLLRALTAAIDPMERLITLESDYELFLDKVPHRHPNVVTYQARQANSEGAGAITLHDLIPDALRKNPDRIIVGEVRADEIIPMFEAMNTGHPGSMCTIHADGTEEIFNRIVMLWTRGRQAQTPPAVIHLHTGQSLDFVVHLRVDPRTHQRFISEVIEVLPPADSELPARNHIYRPVGQAGRAMPHIPPHCLDDLMAVGFDAEFLDSRNTSWPQPAANGKAGS